MFLDLVTIRIFYLKINVQNHYFPSYRSGVDTIICRIQICTFVPKLLTKTEIKLCVMAVVLSLSMRFCIWDACLFLVITIIPFIHSLDVFLNENYPIQFNRNLTLFVYFLNIWVYFTWWLVSIRTRVLKHPFIWI